MLEVDSFDTAACTRSDKDIDKGSKAANISCVLSTKRNKRKSADAHRQCPYKGKLLPEVGACYAPRSVQAVPLRLLPRSTQRRSLGPPNRSSALGQV